jgi:hypothetical protein
MERVQAPSVQIHPVNVILSRVYNPEVSPLDMDSVGPAPGTQKGRREEGVSREVQCGDLPGEGVEHQKKGRRSGDHGLNLRRRRELFNAGG